MRLIDADELMTVTDIREDGTEVTYVPYSEIEDAPTAYDPDKVVKQLENLKSLVPVNRVLDDIVNDKPKELGMLIAYEKAIEIVKAGGVDGN